MITLIKNYINDDRSQKRINVKKIISLSNLINKQIKNIVFKFNNVDDLKRLKNLSTKDGETVVQILLDQSDKIHKFRLKDKRKINNKLLNSLNLIENVVVE